MRSCHDKKHLKKQKNLKKLVNQKSTKTDLKKISYRNLDMITVMDYDFHGFYDGYTGANSPLYHSPESQIEVDRQLNVVRLFLTTFSIFVRRK